MKLICFLSHLVHLIQDPRSPSFMLWNQGSSVMRQKEKKCEFSLFLLRSALSLFAPFFFALPRSFLLLARKRRKKRGRSPQSVPNYFFVRRRNF